MLNDIIHSTKLTLQERLTSPLLGGFLMAWSAWNYKFLVILFSDTPVSETFSLIETVSFPDVSSILTRGLIYPLLSAAGYIFIYPYPALFVYKFTLLRQRKINEVKMKIANETPLTIEDSRRLRAEYVDYELKNQEQISRLNEQIAQLKAALESTNTSEERAPLITVDKLDEKFEPSQLLLLQQLENAGGSLGEEDFIDSSTETKVKAEFDLGELVQKKLLSKNYHNDTYEFTHEGRRVLLENSIRKTDSR